MNEAMAPKCAGCGAPVDRKTARCTACGRQAEMITVKFTSGAPTIVIGVGPKGSNRNTTTTVIAPGARSQTRINPEGEMAVSVTGVRGVGRAGEKRVADMLCMRLNKDGRKARYIPAAADDRRGEDVILEVDGRRLVLQVTVVPNASDFWRAAKVASASTAVPPAHSIEWLEQGVQKKVNIDDRPNVVLALDAQHVAALAEPAIVQQYLEHFGDPVERYGFASVWIVGPTPFQSARLGSGSV